VGHVDERDPELTVQRPQLDLHLLAQLPVEGAERLVEEKDGRLEDQRACQRHALALAAGEPARRAMPERVRVEPHELERATHALLDPRPREPPPLEAERDVPLHREVGEQCVALEDHRQRSLPRPPVVDPLAVESDLSLVRSLEPRQEPEGRRFAAAGRAEDREELAALDRERDAVDGDDLAEPLAHAQEVDRGRAIDRAHSGRGHFFQRSISRSRPRISSAAP
jgi:hypothetical protein